MDYGTPAISAEENGKLLQPNQGGSKKFKLLSKPAVQLPKEAEEDEDLLKIPGQQGEEKRDLTRKVLKYLNMPN